MGVRPLKLWTQNGAVSVCQLCRWQHHTGPEERRTKVARRHHHLITDLPGAVRPTPLGLQLPITEQAVRQFTVLGVLFLGI